MRLAEVQPESNQNEGAGHRLLAVSGLTPRAFTIALNGLEGGLAVFGQRQGNELQFSSSLYSLWQWSALCSAAGGWSCIATTFAGQRLCVS